MTKLATIYNTETGHVVARATYPGGYDWAEIEAAVSEGCALLRDVRAAPDEKVDISVSPPVLIPDPDYIAPAGETLTDAKRRAKQEIDLGAGTVRARTLTSVRGQPETYLAKEAEARAWLADQSQDPALYVLPHAEIGITGATMLDVCTVIEALSNSWRGHAAQIEAVRLGGKKAVEAAETIAEIDDILASLVWPSLPA